MAANDSHTISGKIACQGCDLLLDVSGLGHGEAASCPRCGGFLTRRRDDSYSRVIAFSAAGLVFLVLANSYPFLSFESGGMESVMTLRETPGALWNAELYSIAIIVSAFIILVPACVLLLLLLLCIPLEAERNKPWLTWAARNVFRLFNWAMVEVFIIGVIVSLVKIAAMATVHLGVSFWAYVAFTICYLMALLSLDRYQCWEKIEGLSSR